MKIKKIYIVAVVMIGVAIALLTTSSDDLSTYATFAEAQQTGKEVKVVGHLSKEKEMIYNPTSDPNRFVFYIKDTGGEERKVVLMKAKPQDFEQSEQIVVTGRMTDGEFVATDILMKCPSKYKDEEVFLKDGQQGS
jgi:cytochrome c-type biogenesis protein CcmE